MQQRFTIKDVARLAQVSPATVSLALAGNPTVAAATRERVREAAQRLNYVPNRVAQSLQSQRTSAVALVIPHSAEHVFSHPYFMGVLRGIVDVLNRHDYTLVLSTASSEAAEATAYLKVLNSRQADGIIVASAAIDDPHVHSLIHGGYPFVYLGRYLGNARVPAVGIDDVGGARLATEHLLRHGARRIAHLSGPAGHQSAIDRMNGYGEALQYTGIPRDEALVSAGDYTEDSGYEGMARLLAAGALPDGVFAANDEMAFGALRALHAAGLRVPEDVALIGFDNIRLAEVVTPSLTTIHQPLDQLGHTAAEHLLCQLQGATPEPVQVLLPTHVVMRQSCGCRATNGPGSSR